MNTAKDQGRQLSREQLVGLLEQMIVIRYTEEQLCKDSRAGKLPANVHPYIGEEAIAAGVCAHLNDDDYIASTHRGHGHFLAKGGTPAQLIVEVHGKRDGICRGLGGSMHVADMAKGILGANGIVGGGIGIAAGAALSAQLKGKQQVAVGFFGDGASSQGVLAEVLNFASLWKLPLVLVCENNGFAEFMPTATVTAGQVWRRGESFGVPGVEVDGNDVVAVWEAAGAAIERARRGEGPTIIEAKSFRQRGHVEAETGFLPIQYRTQEEVDSWIKKDPITVFAAKLQAQGTLTDAALKEIESRVADEVAKARAFADESPVPDMAVLIAAGLDRVEAASI